MTQKHRCLSTGILFADIGCAPIDHAPVPGELVQTDRIEVTLGGCASSVAINLARLEVPVGLCGCVGDDGLSDFILHSLVNPLIDTTGIRRVKDCGPGCTLIVNVKGQDRRFVSTTAANASFSFDDIPADWLEETEILYLGGYLMMPLLEDKKTVDYFQRFRAKGGKTVLDVALYGQRPYWEVIRPLLPFVDYFLPNHDEGKIISGLDHPVDQAKFFADAGAQVSVITCGEAGAVYYSEKERFQADVFPVDFVGGTGSGDAFSAGLIAALLDGADPVGLINAASAQGMSCVRDGSATRTVFSRKERQEFLAEHQLKVTPLK